MRSIKVWIAVAVAVLAVGAGAVIATTSGGGHGQHTTTPTSTPAAVGTELSANDQVAQQMVGNLMAQIQQASTDGGQPRVITPEEAEALLRQQLQQLGVPTSK